MIAKKDEDSAAMRAGHDSLRNANEQLSKQLGTMDEECLEKEAQASEYEDEHKQADRALRCAIENVAKLKTELREAADETEDVEEDWRKWCEELEDGIKESRTGEMLYKLLCNKLRKTYSASQAPGYAITEEEMKETRRIKSELNEMESECVRLKTEVKTKHDELIEQREQSIPRWSKRRSRERQRAAVTTPNQQRLPKQRQTNGPTQKNSGEYPDTTIALPRRQWDRREPHSGSRQCRTVTLSATARERR